MGDFDDITIKNEDLTQIHDAVDSLHNNEETYPEGDIPEIPEPMGTVMTRYRVEAEIPKNQLKDFDTYRGFFGRHVAWSNFPRTENLAHIDAIDTAMIHDCSPMLRHLATSIKIKETSIFQMDRANEKRGGFEAELAATSIGRQTADIQHHHILPDRPMKKKRFLGIFPRRNKGGN